MAGQLSYSYQTPRGIAGSLYDISPYAIDSRLNGEDAPGTMKYGMGAVRGASPGVDILVPDNAATPDQFEGIILTGFTNQMNMQGDVIIYPAATVGILRWGRAWVRVAPGETPEYGDDLYLIITGANSGMFSTIDTNMPVNGRFIGGLGTSNIAPVEIYNQRNDKEAE
jgi:hypothetical protein